MTRRFSGWHMAAILVAFFGVVIVVNVTMATFAVNTFGGTVVENSYVASQKYNGWLAEARKQQELGWEIEPRLDAERHVLVSVNVRGAAISGFARHPLGRAPDVPLSFGEGTLSKQALPAGRWVVHLVVSKGANQARVMETLS